MGKWNSEEALLQEREALRAQILELVAAGGELTDEAVNAVDIVMDIASHFDWDRDNDSPARRLAQAWNDWTFNECAAAAMRDLPGEAADA